MILDVDKHELSNDSCYSLIVTPPTRHPMGMSSEGVMLRDCDSLTFSFSLLTPVPVFSIICTISIITRFFLHIHIIHTTIVAFIIFFTRILESLYLYYYNFTITYKIRDCGTVR